MQVLAFGALTLSSYWQYRERDGEAVSKISADLRLHEYRITQLEKGRP